RRAFPTNRPVGNALRRAFRFARRRERGGLRTRHALCPTVECSTAAHFSGPWGRGKGRGGGTLLGLPFPLSPSFPPLPFPLPQSVSPGALPTTARLWGRGRVASVPAAELRLSKRDA